MKMETSNPITSEYAPAASMNVNLGRGWIIAAILLTLVAWIGYGYCLLKPSDFGQVMNGLLVAGGAFGGTLLMVIVAAGVIISRSGFACLYQRAMVMMEICLVGQFVATYLADDLFVRF